MSGATAKKPVRATNGWLRFLAPACIVLVTALAAWAFAEFVLWNKLPGDLVGKWVVEGGAQDGATFDFYRHGAMIGRINVAGREGIVEARIAVQGDKLLSTTTNPHTRQDETRTQIIQTLTRDTLVLEDAQGQTLRLTRAD